MTEQVKNEEQEVKQEEKKFDLGEYLAKEHGIPKAKIAEWKQLHGPIEFVELGGEPFIYRGLRRMEWRELNKSPEVSFLDGLTKEEAVCNTALLYPEALDPSKPAAAGVPTTIFALVAKLSKFEPDFPPQRL